MQLPLTGAATAKTVTLSDEIFARPLNKALLAQAVRTQLSNGRSANAHAKTRGAVSGGGRKPWRQKGTGRARVGSSRTPLWRGGGIIFGPSPDRNFSLKMPTKMAKQALFQALSLKAAEKKLLIVPEIALEKPSTKSLLSRLDAFKVELRSGLLVLGASDKNVRLSARNLSHLETVIARSLSTYDVMRAETLILTEAALESLQGPQKPAVKPRSTPRKKAEKTEGAAK